MALWRKKPAPEPEPSVEGPMPSIFDQPKPPPLPLFTPGQLIPPSWRVIGPEGPMREVLRFLPDGRLAGSDRRWSLADGKLLVLDAGGDRQMVFERRETRSRREIVAGHSPHHEGELLLAPVADDLLSVQSLGQPDAPLLIVFNSHRNPLAGPDTQWEFTECMDDGRADVVLIAERSDPPAWFLDKTARVLDRLRGLPAVGYRDFVFLGKGTGGFAALMFAEMFSYEFNECRVRSVTINAQTAHGAEDEAAIRAATPPDRLPPFIEADTLARKDCAVAAIRELVRMSTRRRGDQVEHRLLYDAANPAQQYYAHSLDDLSGFALHPAPLGLPVDLGTEAMLRSAEFSSALAWGLKA